MMIPWTYLKAGKIWLQVKLSDVIEKDNSTIFYFNYLDYTTRLDITKYGHFNNYDWSCTCNHGSVMQATHPDKPCAHIIACMIYLSLRYNNETR